MTDQPDNRDHLPASLQDVMRDLYTPAPMSSTRDAAILNAVRASVKARKARRWRFTLQVAGGTIAAAVAVAATLWWVNRSSVSYEPAAPAVTLADAGTPSYEPTGDIRDAFFLARQLKAKTSDGKGLENLDPHWDITRDGNVDERDVQALAIAAVKLDRGVVR